MANYNPFPSLKSNTQATTVSYNPFPSLKQTGYVSPTEKPTYVSISPSRQLIEAQQQFPQQSIIPKKLPTFSQIQSGLPLIQAQQAIKIPQKGIIPKETLKKTKVSAFSPLKISLGYGTPYEAPKQPKELTDEERNKIFGITKENANKLNLTGNKYEDFLLKTIGATTAEKQLNTIKPIEKGIGRAIFKLGNSVLLDAPSLLSEKINPEYYNKAIKNRKLKDDPFGAAADFGLDIAGWLIPYGVATKSLKLAGLGAKEIPKLLETASKTEKFIRGTKVAGELAKEGARGEALVQAGIIGTREAISPEKNTFKQNLESGLYNVLLGGLADPALHGAINLGKIGLKALDKSILTKESKDKLIQIATNPETAKSSDIEKIITNDKNVKEKIQQEVKPTDLKENDYVYPMSEKGKYLIYRPLKIKSISILEDGKKYYKLEDNRFYPKESLSKYDEIPQEIKKDFIKPPEIAKQTGQNKPTLAYTLVKDMTYTQLKKETNKIFTKKRKNPDYVPTNREMDIFSEYNKREDLRKAQATPTPEAQAIPKELSENQIKSLSDIELQKQIDIVKEKGQNYEPEDWENNLFVEKTLRTQKQKKSESSKLETATKEYNQSLSKESVTYGKNDVINHSQFGEGKVLEAVNEGNFQKLKVKFGEETKTILTEFAPVNLVKKGRSRVSQVIDNQIEQNRIKINQQKSQGNTTIYSSIVPLPTKLQLLYVKQGALYIAKGIVDFNEWSAEMVKSLGESIKPHLKKLYRDSLEESKKVIDNISIQVQNEIKSENLKNKAKGKMKFKRVTGTIEKKGFVPQELTEQAKKQYRQLGNVQTLQAVNNDIQKNGIDASYADLLQSGEPSAYNTVMAGRLTDEFQRKADLLRRSGDFEQAQKINEKIVNLISDLRDKLNNAGQATQAMALYNKLDENGLILLAQKKIKSISKRKGTSAKLSTDEIQEITDISRTMKDATNNENVGNRVLDILDEAQGRELLPSEVQELADFVNDSKVFVEETITGVNQYKSPKYKSDITDAELPKEMSVTENKKEITDFLNKHEENAKSVIKKAEKTTNLTPLDLYANYVVIGASKIANGHLKFDDWSKQMIKDLGEGIQPYLKDIFSNSKKALKSTSEKITDPDVKKLLKYINKLLAQKKLKPENYQEAREMAKEIGKLSKDLREQALEDFEIFLNSKFQSTIGQKAASIQRIMQLLNPKTIIRNLIGNEMFYRLERINKYLATPIDIAASKLSGKERSITFKKYNQESYWKNWLKGARAGYKGITLDYNLMTQYDIERQSLQDIWGLRTLEKLLGATLYSFDYAAYKRAVGDTMGEMATLNAINNKINLKKMTKEERNNYFENFFRNASEEIKNLTNEYGKYATFQDDNILSIKAQQLKRTLNFKKEFGIGNLVINYPKTPGALIVRSLEYSPMGILRSMYHLFLFVRNHEKSPTSRKAFLDLSRALIGLGGLTAFGWFAYEKGLILNKEKDYDVSELQKQAGIYGNQINISAINRYVNSGFKNSEATPKKGDRLVTYDWAQPLAMSIALGSNASQALREGEKATKTTTDVSKAALNSMLGGLDTIVQQPLLSGVQDLLNFYPGSISEQVKDKFMGILTSLPSSFTPTAANQLRQLLDNSVRETYSPEYFGLQTGINRALARLPVLSEKLPQKYDTLGNLKKSFQESGVKNKFGKGAIDAFNVFLNPSFVTKYNPTPEAAYVLDVINRTGDKTIAPRLVTRKEILNKEKLGEGNSLILTGKQYAEMQKLTGDYTRQSISRISSGSFSDSYKQKLLNKILEKSYEKARDEIIRKYKNQE